MRKVLKDHEIAQVVNEVAWEACTVSDLRMILREEAGASLK